MGMLKRDSRLVVPIGGVRYMYSDLKITHLTPAPIPVVEI